MGRHIQITIDCADPDRLAAFWADVLGYRLQPPPDEFPTWADYWRAHGLPEEELSAGITNDRIEDPDGVGPPIWFQQVPEAKTLKNRVHLDVRASGGRAEPLAERRRRIDAEVARLTGIGATVLRVLYMDGLDHYAVVMQDPEGNEFCVN
jgi:catechol 2,3-dioxygenase-like lactoylglutathione lyase family enzyme